MSNEEAKQILALFRPGATDGTDSDFTEALGRTRPQADLGRGVDQPDPELAQWFMAHCASYVSIRNNFMQIPVPPGLKDRILAEGKDKVVTPMEFRPVLLLRIAAVVALCAGLAMFFWPSHEREDGFETYRNRMARTARQPYGMGLYSHDLKAINQFLASRKAPADYVLPNGVIQAQPVGCAILRWQGAPVSMLCFQSGKPLPTGRKSDIWLFVVDESSVRNGPAAGPPIITPMMQLTTATWVRDGKMYILAAAGDEAFLRKYF